MLSLRNFNCYFIYLHFFLICEFSLVVSGQFVCVLVNIEHYVNPVRPQCQAGCQPADTYRQTPPTSALNASPHRLMLR